MINLEISHAAIARDCIIDSKNLSAAHIRMQFPLCTVQIYIHVATYICSKSQCGIKY